VGCVGHDHLNSFVDPVSVVLAR